jgi:ATP/maltotriose-dependent transcriptional regulator MalT
MKTDGLPKNQSTLGLENMEAGYGSTLTLLVAPAGSGKTRLLRLWAAKLQSAQKPVAWLGLRADDNAPECFWADLLSSLNRVYPLDLPEKVEDLESAMTSLINRLAGLQGSLVFILDDYHLINNESVHSAVRLLLDYPPPSLSLVIATRSEPPLQIPRLRARRQLTEIRLAEVSSDVADR